MKVKELRAARPAWGGVGARLVFHVAAHVARHAPPVLKELDRRDRELAAAAQKLGADTAEPIKTGIAMAFRKIA